MSTTNPSGDSSYGQILKSSSIVASATAINYVIGLLRVKIVALLLGPAGVGLVGLYVSVVGAVQTVAQLGINESGVRQVAAVAGKDDGVHLAQTVTALRRICWATGILGWLLAVAFAVPLSQWIFESDVHALALAVLEAAAHRIPVVQTDECNFPELAAAGGAWECRPERESLEKSLRDALTAEDTERAERGVRGRALVEKSYSWDQIAGEVLAASA